MQGVRSGGASVQSLMNEDKIKHTYTYLKERRQRLHTRLYSRSTARRRVKTGTEFRKFSSIFVELPKKII
jgi:hypothetical protein